MTRVILDKIDMSCGRTSSITGRNRRQVGFGHVACKNCWLRCEQEKTARDCLFFRGQFCSDCRFTGVEMRGEFLDDRVFDFCRFFTGMQLFL